MPALKICGKRTILGGDDLRVYTYFAIALRIVQLAVVLPLIAITHRQSDKYRIDNSEPVCRATQRRPDLIDHSRTIFVGYLAMAVILAFVGLAIEIGVLLTTGRGTPTQPEKRWRLGPLCFTKMVPMSALRLVVLIFGVLAVVVIKDYCLCGARDGEFTSKCDEVWNWQSFFFILMVTHLIEASVVATYGLYFLCKATTLPSCFSTQTKWTCLCSCCCNCATLLTCCFAGGQDTSTSDFTDIAMLLSNFFGGRGILDIVLTDIVVGFRVLAREQVQLQRKAKTTTAQRSAIHVLASVVAEEPDIESSGERQGGSSRKEVVGEMVSYASSDDDDDLDHLVDQIDPRLLLLGASSGIQKSAVLTKALGVLDQDEAALQRKTARSSVVFQLRRDGSEMIFMAQERAILTRVNPVDKFAIAEGARFMRWAAGIYHFKDFSYHQANLCAKAFRKMKEDTVGDRFDELGILNATGLGDSSCEVVYAQLRGGVARTLYSIVIDHDWKTVVVTIRGTLSLDDVVADLTLHPAPLKELGERCGFDGSAYFAHKGVVRATEWIYNDLESHGVLDDLLQREDSPVAGYRLRLTGHSLGAGCAAILSFLLRPRYPDLRCLCFSPPGCTVSLNMAEACKGYLTSYIVDDDVVPRLSLDALEHLRHDICLTVARIKVPKHDAMHAQNESVDAILHDKKSTPESEFSKQIDRFEEHHAERKTGLDASLQVSLHLPGKLVHLVGPASDEEEPAPRGLCCLGSMLGVTVQEPPPAYGALWVQRNDLCEIIISPHFLDDHKSPFQLEQLERVAQEFGMESPFKCEEAI